MALRTRRRRIALAMATGIRIKGTPGIGRPGAAFSFVPSVSGGVAPWTFARTGAALPGGWNFSTVTGAIAGTTNDTGTFVGTITVTDATGATASRAYSIVVAEVPEELTIAGAPVDGVQGQPWSFAPTVDGGTAPCSFAWVGTALAPFGIVLDSETGEMEAASLLQDGAISGTLTVTDAEGATDSLSVAVEVTEEVVPALPLANYTFVPSGRWTANHSAVTVSAGRVIEAAPIAGGIAANMVKSSLVDGPEERTDLLGRKYWRMTANALQERTMALAARNVTVIMVMRRLHRPTPAEDYCSMGYATADGGTPPNLQGGLLRSHTTVGSRHYGTANRYGTDPSKIRVGSELHVVAVVQSGTGGRIYYNNLWSDLASAPQPGSGIGFTLGHNAYTPGGTAIFEVYELAVKDAQVPHADMESTIAALQSTYGIANIIAERHLEGDSITAGWPTSVGIGEAQVDLLGEPGSALCAPAGYRVTAAAVSGDEVSGLRFRRDQAGGAASTPLNGGADSTVIIQIGYNHNDATTVAPELVALLNTETTGYLQRGWRVIIHTNIACGNTDGHTRVEIMRAALLDPAFLVACDAHAGGTYAGRVEINPLHLWEVDGQTIFNLRTDVNSHNYPTDPVHPGVHGNRGIIGSLHVAEGWV